MAEATPPFRARQRALSYPDDDDDASMPRGAASTPASSRVFA